MAKSELPRFQWLELKKREVDNLNKRFTNRGIAPEEMLGFRGETYELNAMFMLISQTEHDLLRQNDNRLTSVMRQVRTPTGIARGRAPGVGVVLGADSLVDRVDYPQGLVFIQFDLSLDIDGYRLGRDTILAYANDVFRDKGIEPIPSPYKIPPLFRDFIQTLGNLTD